MVLFQIAIAAGAGERRSVRGNELGAKECHLLKRRKFVMRSYRVRADVGAQSVPEGNFIRVQEVGRRASRPWGRVFATKTGTLNRSQHLPRRTDSR